MYGDHRERERGEEYRLSLNVNNMLTILHRCQLCVYSESCPNDVLYVKPSLRMPQGLKHIIAVGSQQDD